MRERARVLVITGPGKGKTTAAMGVILRCLAHGKSVLLSRFAKPGESGELVILRDFPRVHILSSSRGMTPPADHPDYPAHVAAARELFDATRREAGGYDCLVMDEICGMIARGMIPEAEVIDFLEQLSPRQTAVLTGRGAGPGLIAAADTVSEILSLKHGYRRGIQAERGVEF